jgi:hypothetical protein
MFSSLPGRTRAFLILSRGVALSPCPSGDFEVSDPLVFFEK